MAPTFDGDFEDNRGKAEPLRDGSPNREYISNSLTSASSSVYVHSHAAIVVAVEGGLEPASS